jgi:RNA polymerase sigma-70 factor (ECF subfamily)
MKENGRYMESRFVAALKNGNALAFNELFHMYGKRLYHFSLGYLKSKMDAEEVVQEVFMKIWHNHSSLNPGLSFKAYLFTIAYRQIAERFRKNLQEKQYLHEIATESIVFTEEMDERVNYRSLLDLVERIIQQLPERQKEVIILRKMDGLTISEIATRLDISPKTVEHHITEALKNLKTGLDAESISGLLFFVLFVRDKNS